jgi:CHAT domain-containing protein
LEIDNIYNTIHKGGISATVYEGDNGTESSFKYLSGTASDIIHMATHGYYYSKEEAYYYEFFNDENLGKSSGVRSGLILAGGNHDWNDVISVNGEDGFLTADEISGMDLSGTKLLTLSACQTALGDIASDGVYGMQRSFKVAGVNTIVMSLWQVDDEASYLMMDKLYEGIVKGMSCHEAFKAARSFVRKWAENLVKEQKKEIERQYTNLPDIREKRLSELLPPEYYWAAFIMLD